MTEVASAADTADQDVTFVSRSAATATGRQRREMTGCEPPGMALCHGGQRLVPGRRTAAGDSPPPATAGACGGPDYQRPRSRLGKHQLESSQVCETSFQPPPHFRVPGPGPAPLAEPGAIGGWGCCELSRHGTEQPRPGVSGVSATRARLGAFAFGPRPFAPGPASESRS